MIGASACKPDGKGITYEACQKTESNSDDSFGLRDTLVWCGIPIVIVLLVRMFLFGFYVIPSGSMMNTIEPGDRVITCETHPQSLQAPARRRGGLQGPRPLAAAGETAADSAATTSSNDSSACPVTPWHAKGRASRSPSTAWPSTKAAYIRSGRGPQLLRVQRETVTAGHVFVMGDNRANSADSRYHQDDSSHGLVPVSDVVGVGLVKVLAAEPHQHAGRASRRVHGRAGRRLAGLMSVSVVPTLDMERAIAGLRLRRDRRL